MPKPNYNDAPSAIKRACEQHRLNTQLSTPSGPLTVAAIGTLAWLRAAHARGYDLRPDQVPTPAHDRIAAFTGDAAELAALRTVLSLELQYERQCKQLAESMRNWAAAPSEAELGVARRADLRRELDEIAVEQRTQQIMADAEAARVEKARTAARKQAEKEIGS